MKKNPGESAQKIAENTMKMLKVSKKAQDQQRGLPGEEENKKQYMQEIDAAIYLKKTDKIKRT